MLEGLAQNQPEKYSSFWKEFGQVLKEGPAEDFANKDRIAKLLRFSSTHSNSDVQDIALMDYVSRMKKDQDKIYYVVDGKDSAQPPLLEQDRVFVLDTMGNFLFQKRKHQTVKLLNDRFELCRDHHDEGYRGHA